MRATRALALTAVLLLTGCAERVPAPEYPQRYGLRPAAADPGRQARRQRILDARPEIEAMVYERFGAERMPALAAAVLDGGELLWSRVFGVRDLSAGGELSAHTVFRIGSVTKTVTAMAMLRLRDEGLLALDSPAVAWLPELGEVLYPTLDSPLVTSRHLLTHSSGLPRLGRLSYASRPEPVSEADLVAGLKGLRLEHVPGTDHVYSNLGFGLLGLVVGRASGVPYRRYVSEEILAPLGMSGTAWEAEQVPPGRLATGYALEGEKYVTGPHWRMGAAEALGGLYASLDDMIRYAAFHLTAWPPDARPDREPLRNASVRESHLLGGFARASGQGTGLGWVVSELRAAGHAVSHVGATRFYAAVVMFLPEHQLGFVALTSCGQLNGALDKLAAAVLRKLVLRAKG
ncbi:MAG: beta-lactamase family protein [Deltaproteobacteria bacterium]|nr:beta-lactamase family protein [Deltaproteobacteria bacterium]